MGKTGTFWQYGETGTLGYLGQIDAICRTSRVLSARAGRQDALHHILGVLAGELGLKIVDTLKRCNGNLAATARDLKATPRIIRHRVKELTIDYKQYSSKRG